MLLTPGDGSGAGHRSDPVGDVTRWLSARSVWALFGIFLAWFAAWSVAVFLVLDAVITGGRQEEMATVAAPLMPAIGTLFAFLTAFVIATEWTQHRDAERNVVLEAGAALRFALACRWPTFDGSAPLRRLVDYLDAVVTAEWPSLVEGRGEEGAGARLAEFEHSAREAVSRAPQLPAPVVAELLQSADAVALARAERVQMARRELPPALFVLTFISGVVLNLDAISLALQHETLLGIVIGGLVLVIALDLALVVAIGAPFRGSLRVDARPVVDVRDRVAGDLAPRG